MTPVQPVQVVGKSFDSSWITPSLWGVLLVKLVIVGTIIIIVLIASCLLHALSLLVLVFDLVTCISTADDIMQVIVISIMPSAALLLWSE
jgi:hypothetical protein